MIKTIQEPINIYSKSSDWLGKALTNPCYDSSYDICPIFNHPLTHSKLINPQNYILPSIPLFRWAIRRYGNNATTHNAWSHSVESWYFANTKNKEGKDLYNQNEKENIMLKLIICKLTSYTILVEEIHKRGGLEWLQKCSHIVSKNKNWEGVGENSNFIKILCKAYKIVTSTENLMEQLILI